MERPPLGHLNEDAIEERQPIEATMPATCDASRHQPEVSTGASMEEGRTVDNTDAHMADLDLECCVCLGEITELAKAPCGHTFCMDCILSVLEVAPPEWSGNCPLCRKHVSVYNLRNDEGDTLARPEVGSLYGSVFVQGGQVGLASYHFVSETESYISYEEAPSNWRLDDGTPPPGRKYFENSSWDPETLTFRGVVYWQPKFHGDARWHYEVVFSEDFTGVVAGSVSSYSTIEAEKPSSVTKFSPPWECNWDGHLNYLRWTAPPSSIYGNVYVQGAVYAPYLEGVASYHFDSPEDCYISYNRAPEAWVLADGSRPPAKKPFRKTSYDPQTRTFKGTIYWAPHSFAGSNRWEYTMRFNDDFTYIEMGEMQAYCADERQSNPPVLRFRSPTNGGYIQTGTLCYVQKPRALVQSEKARRCMPKSKARSISASSSSSDSPRPMATEQEDPYAAELPLEEPAHAQQDRRCVIS
eukprot:TRINITY_DN123754_c0_g1_i1.p1 TRINITY_DN123754_c0_g1~~TRINITY_DN123754_c0_g1_i1.p1  ORF type:complete len:468 (+),score=51.70 TRINITY_DN123754_c0_g1_i1:81-1484(+)